mmetsp:Transcript_73131/g.201818  ORF Transcript_73131/g.201818 Transcript_73131/m.201818 type:complete len:205 (+) Transcript_73131:388-1002(+)
MSLAPSIVTNWKVVIAVAEKLLKYLWIIAWLSGSSCNWLSTVMSSILRQVKTYTAKVRAISVEASVSILPRTPDASFQSGFHLPAILAARKKRRKRSIRRTMKWSRPDQPSATPDSSSELNPARSSTASNLIQQSSKHFLPSARARSASSKTYTARNASSKTTRTPRGRCRTENSSSTPMQTAFARMTSATHTSKHGQRTKQRA